MLHTILRLPATKSQSGQSRSTIYLRMEQGLWTKQIKLGPRAIGWPANEVAALIIARISGQSDDEIRDLVKSLHTQRKGLNVALGVQQ